MKQMRQKNFSSKKERTRGSMLLTAVLFSFLVMSLMGGYLYVSSGEFRFSSRSFLSNASFNLAEGGIEFGLDAIQNKDSSGWLKGTDASGTPYWARAFKEYDLGSNIKGDIRVVILNPSSSGPEIYAEGEAYRGSTTIVSKQLYVNLASGFMPFQNGFNTKKGMVLSGNNVTFDSYDSLVGSYGWGNINSNITIATTSVEVDALNIGNADIYGYVATGGSPPDVGPNGSITEYSNPGVLDSSRLTMDYYAEFPNVTAPTLSSPKTSLPTSGFITGGEYLINNWSMRGSRTLYIAGDTTIVATGDMSMSGTSEIYIDPNATVNIYIEGSLDIGGNGIMNMSYKPEQLMVFGTDTTEGNELVKIHGNGYLAAAVYAPNANIEMKGGGNAGRVYGSVVGYDAKLTGNSHFSYDEALAAFNLGEGGYEIEEWAELAGSDLSILALDMSKYGL